jgi:hypothetical protein
MPSRTPPGLADERSGFVVANYPGPKVAERFARQVEKVFAAVASGAAWNFPVLREALGHEDALYSFKGGFD